MQPGSQFLYDNNLSLIPSSIIVRNRFFEKINERWWERSDIELKFYNSIRETDANVLEIEKLWQAIEQRADFKARYTSREEAHADYLKNYFSR